MHLQRPVEQWLNPRLPQVSVASYGARWLDAISRTQNHLLWGNHQHVRIGSLCLSNCHFDTFWAPRPISETHRTDCFPAPLADFEPLP